MCPGSSLGIAGFSLGATLVLKMLGEDPGAQPAALTRAAAVDAPIDLDCSLRAMETGANRLYDAYFTRMLLRRVERLRQAVDGLDWPDPPERPRSLRAFDVQTAEQLWVVKPPPASHYTELGYFADVNAVCGVRWPYVTGGSQDLDVIDAETGEIRWSHQLPNFGDSGFALRGSLLVVSAGLVIDVRTGKAKLLFDPSDSAQSTGGAH